jgi:hypothetical protein
MEPTLLVASEEDQNVVFGDPGNAVVSMVGAGAVTLKSISVT